MATRHLALVSGANGHLGYNLVQLLLQKGIPVWASVRNLRHKSALNELNCETVQADTTDKASLIKALEGIDTFYAVGAAFKLWAKNPQKETYEVNLQGTQNMLEAAAIAKVKRIVYVTCISSKVSMSFGRSPQWPYGKQKHNHVKKSIGGIA